MTIEIPDPPTIAACTDCMRPLRWLYSARTGRWVAFATEPTDPKLLRVDDCQRHNPDKPSWRDTNPYRHDPDAAERAKRGRAEVDAALERTRREPSR